MVARQDNDNNANDRPDTNQDGRSGRARSAYETARDRSRDAAKQVTDQLAFYPVGAVLGGLAIGALIGFFLPRGERETRLLGDSGRRLTGAARDAVQKGIDAGRERAQDLSGEIGSKVGRAVAEAVGVTD